MNGNRTFSPRRGSAGAGRRMAALLFGTFLLSFRPAILFAAPRGIRKVLSSLKGLSGALSQAVTGAGAILVLYYIFELGLTLNAGEAGGIPKALRGIGAGCLFLIAPAVIEAILNA